MVMPPCTDCNEAMLIIFPYPSCTIWRPNTRQKRNTARRFTLMTVSQSSMGKSTAGARRCTPALLTRISTCPKEASATSRASFAAVSVPISSVRGRKRRPVLVIRSANASVCEVCWIEMRSAPASASATAMPNPRPRLPPVTRATFPSSRNRSIIKSLLLMELRDWRTRGCCKIGNIFGLTPTRGSVHLLFGESERCTDLLVGVRPSPSATQHQSSGLSPSLFRFPENLHAPDFLILVLIAVIRIEEVLRATIIRNIAIGNEMNCRDIPAGLHACKGAVQLVHALPALKAQ